MAPSSSAVIPVLAALALLAAPAAQAGSRDPLYAWSDASGAVRYTTHPERIPEAFRAGAVVVERGRDAAANAARLPGARTEPVHEPSVEEWLEGGLGDDATPPATSTPPVEAAPDDAAAKLDARIAELQAAVDRDETALQELVSDPASAGRLRESPELAAIAKRLPRLQRELRELRARREALAGRSPSAPASPSPSEEAAPSEGADGD